MKLDIDFSKEQEDLIKKLTGILGSNEADVLKTIFVMWLMKEQFGNDLIKKRLRL